MANILKETKDYMEEMPSLEKEKKPGTAAILGLLFGAIGIGLYFKSWRDFFVCLIIFVVLTFAIPGLGEFPGWLFASAYGFFRADSSNKRLRERQTGRKDN